MNLVLPCRRRASRASLPASPRTRGEAPVVEAA